jgi:hypothetical protein
MQIQFGQLDFSKAKDTGPRTANTTVVFEKDVLEAAACLTGFISEFSDLDGKEFGKLSVDLSRSIDKNTVTVTATYGLRDAGERYDVNYGGRITFAVIAELES